jgi:deoxyribodipyrimidine photo-lyase
MPATKPAPKDLRTKFRSRQSLVDYVSELFPEAAKRGSDVSEIKGGREAAIEQLDKIEPARYGRTRSNLEGAVTRLSPYLRHGVLSLAEVRDKALELSDAKAAYKLVNELSWRDYFQRVYAELGDDIWKDLEPYKTGWKTEDYADTLPDDIRHAKTGARCIDYFSTELSRTGYLHNHIRLWLSAYIVHWRRVKWQAGTGWFLEHLLDGDPASNALGWQWVASTWRRYPYIWNRGSLIKSGGKFLCESCPLYESGCPFASTYETLSKRLFPNPRTTERAGTRQELKSVEYKELPKLNHSENTVVWVHGDSLSPTQVALNAYPNSPALYVWDDALLEVYQITLKRLVFLYESLLELPVTVRRGDVAQEVISFARENKATTVATTFSPSPRFEAIKAEVEKHLPVQVWHDTPFIRPEKPLNLTSHAYYWWTTKDQALSKSA